MRRKPEKHTLKCRSSAANWESEDVRVSGAVELMVGREAIMSEQESGIWIDEDAEWTAAGGHYRSGDKPSSWKRKQSGAWDRKELVPYGKASRKCRDRYFRCPECEGRLLPTNVQYRFGCEGCGLVFGTGWGGLWGYPPDHPKAMWLTDRRS